MLTNQEKLQIEEIRRRSKDYHTSNVRFFEEYVVESLDKLKNTLFLSSFALVGYLGAVNKIPNRSAFCYFIASIVLGYASYIFIFILNSIRSLISSDLAENMSESTVLDTNPLKHFNEMIEKEKPIHDQAKYARVWHLLQLISVIGQGIFLVLFAISTLQLT
jgi:hypothetical protein